MSRLPEKLYIYDEDDVSSGHRHAEVMIDGHKNVYYVYKLSEHLEPERNWLDDPVYGAYDLDLWKEEFSVMNEEQKQKMSKCMGSEWNGKPNASNIEAYIGYYGLDSMHDGEPICTMREFLEREKQSLIVFNGTSMDSDGYPTEEYIEYIKGYDPIKYSLNDFIETLSDAWVYGDWGFILDGNKLALATGGWKGNEEIISAISGSMFSWMYWQSSHRGGRHEYEIPLGSVIQKGEDSDKE